jgi:hypothetical protein
VVFVTRISEGCKEVLQKRRKGPLGSLVAELKNFQTQDNRLIDLLSK